MIISREHKFIILSVPKTGSTSMQHVFKNHFGKDVHCVYGNVNNAHGLRKHIPAKELRRKLKIFKPFKTIAVVRNPWDYVVSWYAYTRRLPKDHNRSSIGKDFNEFLKTMKHVWFNYPEPWRKKTWDVTQMTYVSDNDNNIIVDEIVKFEDLRKHGIPKTMSKILNIDMDLEDVNKNTSQRSEDYRDYYNDESIEIVNKTMGIDIKTFNYEY